MALLLAACGPRTHFPPLPRLDPICWDKKNQWSEKKCGAYTMTETIIY